MKFHSSKMLFIKNQLFFFKECIVNIRLFRSILWRSGLSCAGFRINKFERVLKNMNYSLSKVFVIINKNSNWEREGGVQGIEPRASHIPSTGSTSGPCPSPLLIRLELPHGVVLTRKYKQIMLSLIFRPLTVCWKDHWYLNHIIKENHFLIPSYLPASLVLSFCHRFILLCQRVLAALCYLIYPLKLLMPCCLFFADVPLYIHCHFTSTPVCGSWP